MDPRRLDERTPWQRAWPWCVGLIALLVQALTFTTLYNHLSEFWRVAFMTPLVLFPLGGSLLVLLRPAAWRGPRTRWLRGVVLAGTVVWCALNAQDFIEGFFEGFNSGVTIGAEMKAADRRERGEAVVPGPAPTVTPPELPLIPKGWGFALWVTFTGVGALLLTRFQDAKDEAARQRLNANLAQDAALRAKLAPHFIFNALNTLHAQIEHDARGAQATTERLAQLFRQVIEVSERPTIPLKQELAFVEGYLGIEKARLGERLQVVIDVPEELEALEIPPLSLQVLVENAVKHGVGSLEAGGLVRVGARRGNRGLMLFVEDPGDGRGAGVGTGTALETLRSRLARPEDLMLAPCERGFRAEFRWRQK